MSSLQRVLDGVSVLDFTQIGAGPTCTMLLADLGASVIKVEPLEGELGRRLGPGWIGDEAALFHGFNRNKKSISIDLKSSSGADVARRLASRAHIVVESMRPGVMDRLGLGQAKLKEINPDLIWCSISAYGQNGPYAQRAGVDGILQADSGLMSLIGFAHTGPAKVQTPIVDVFTGYVAAFSVLAAVLATRSGPVPPIDVSLFRSAIALQQAALTSFLADSHLPEKQGSAAPYSAPNEAFETADGWIMVAAYNGGRWERLCACLGMTELAGDERFRNSSLRVANRQAMVDTLTPLFKAANTSHWLKVLEAADILCAPVSTYDRLLEHPQLITTNVLTTVDDRRHGSVRMPDFPVRVAGVEPRKPSPAPALGEDTVQILSELGLSGDEIQRLLDAGVARAAPATTTSLSTKELIQ